MKGFAGIVGFVTATTIYVGGAIGVFLLLLAVGCIVVYVPDWSAL